MDATRRKEDVKIARCGAIDWCYRKLLEKRHRQRFLNDAHVESDCIPSQIDNYEILLRVSFATWNWEREITRVEAMADGRKNKQ